MKKYSLLSTNVSLLGIFHHEYQKQYEYLGKFVLDIQTLILHFGHFLPINNISIFQPFIGLVISYSVKFALNTYGGIFWESMFVLENEYFIK